MNTHQYLCPQCGKTLRSALDVAGKSVKCLGCQAVFVAGPTPALEEDVPEAAKVVPPPLPPRRTEPRPAPRRADSFEEEYLPRHRQKSSPLPVIVAGVFIALMLVFAGGVVLVYRLVRTQDEARDLADRSRPTVSDAPPPRIIELARAKAKVGPPKTNPERIKDPEDIAAEIAAIRIELLRKGTTDDYIEDHGPKRLAAWRESAAKGSVAAQWLVGRCLDQGAGVDEDVDEAVTWYRKAAEQGFDLAQNSLGIAYSEGLGVEEDEDEAIKWLTKAAEQGEPTAMNNLGAVYVDRDTTRDSRTAFQWFKKSAELNSRLGQFNLAESYEEGRGVKKSMVEAANWYLKASDQGDSDSTVRLIVLYEEGRGIDKNPAEAKRLRERAREQLGDGAEKAVAKQAFKKYPIGKPAPVAEGKIDGKPFKLSDYKGKVVVLKFGATWCAPCRAMIPHKKKMVQRLAAEPFAYLDVDIDENEELSDHWFVSAVPVVYVIDTNGVIRDHEVFDADLDRAVDKLLNELKGKK